MFGTGGWDGLRERVGDLLPEGSLRARFAKGTFWALAGVVASYALMLAASAIVARVFDDRALYGELGVIRNTLATFGVFAGLGLGLTATKHVAELRRVDPARAGRILRLTFVAAGVSAAPVALACLATAPWITRFLNAPSTMVNSLRIGSVVLLFETLNGAQTGALAGFEAFRTSSAINVLRGLLMLPLMVAGAKLRGVEGAVAGMAVASAFGWAANRVALRRLMRRDGIPRAAFRDLRDELRVIWGFVLPTYLGGALWVLAPLAASAVLLNAMGQKEGYAAQGLFFAANQWQFPVTLIPAQLSLVLIPMLSSLRGPQAAARRERLSGAAHLAILLTVLPAAAVLSVLAGWVMTTVYGPKYTGSEGVWLLRAALFVGGAKAFGMVPDMLLKSRGAMWTSFALNLAWAALVVGLVALAGSHDIRRFADSFSVAVALTTVAGLVWCAATGITSWRLALRIGLDLALLLAFTYGVFFARTLAAQLAVVGVACAVAAVAALAAWRRRK